jgi:hypothetical protein
MSKLNPNGPFKQRDGSAITATSTNVNTGGMKMAGSSSLLRTVHPGAGNNENTRLVNGNDCGVAQWGSFVTATGVSGATTGITNSSSPYAGLAKLTANNHPFNATGQTVHVNNNATGVSTTGLYQGIHRIVAILDPHSVVLNTPYVSDQTGITYATGIGGLAWMAKRNYAMRGVSGSVHGQANAKMSTPASDYGRDKVHGLNTVRTQKTTTAIRAGNLSLTSGVFTTKPEQTSDLGNMGTDEALVDSTTKFGLKGEFVYRHGGPSGVMGDYDGKTD